MRHSPIGFRFALAIALAFTGVYAGATSFMRLEHGLLRVVHLGTGTQEQVISRRVTPYIGSESFNKEARDAGRPEGHELTWTGIWSIPVTDAYDIYVGVNNHVIVALDGRVLVQRDGPASASGAIVTRATLDKGPHRIAIAYVQNGTDHLDVSWASNGSGPRPLGQAELYPDLRAMRAYRWLAPLKWAALLSWLLIPVAAAGRWRLPRTRAERISGAVQALLVCVLVYAALLRFDALVQRWGFIPGSASAQRVQSQLVTFVRHIRPDSLGWDRAEYPPGGDPYSYLQQARERSSFYSAHLREPVFPFSVKPVLSLLGQADVAVCVTSALFSWLTVLAIYFVGRTFSPWVGLGAALALAVERTVVHFGVSGQRDDTFAFFVAAVAAVSLWVHERPSDLRSACWGLFAGAACLTRITALTFVLPLLGYRIWTSPKRMGLRSAAVSLSVLILVVSPFLIDCWIRFGTPFYSVTGLGRSWDFGHSGGQQPTPWSRYLFEQLTDKPFTLLDTLCAGAIRSFQNKWVGFQAWSATAGLPLAASAAIGIVALAWSAPGRILLLILATSLVPYLFISNTLPSGALYRYTLHAYPFFLIAAVLIAERVASSLVATVRHRRPPRWSELRPLVPRTSMTLALVASVWLAATVLPYPRMLDELRLHHETILLAGSRDRLFFRSGWSAPFTVGNVTFRSSVDHAATVWVPMMGGREIRLTVRLDPLVVEGTPQQVVRLALNGTAVSSFALDWDPEHVGSYSALIPRQLVHDGLNRLDITSAYSTPGGSTPGPSAIAVDGRSAGTGPGEREHARFRLWYALVSFKPATASLGALGS